MNRHALRGSMVIGIIALVCGAAVLVGRPGLVGAGQEPPHREWAKDAKPAGSKSCEKCHPEHYQRWDDSAHSRMVRLPTPQTVLGDFTTDNTLKWKGYTYRMFIRNGKYFLTVAPRSGESTTYQVDYAIGSRRVQGYMSRLQDGRLYLLPVYWQIGTQSWFDSSLITPHTDEGVGVKQYWNTNCLACHATDLRFGFDAKTGQYSTRWLELAIGCEACHNPGSKHNEFFEKKPLRDYVRTEFNDTFISNQRYFDARRSTELCASCHGTKINYFLGYWPGDRAYDYFVPLVVTDQHDQQGDFYPDSRPTRSNHFLEFLGSKCYLKGKATCISCHEGHSSENESLLRVPKEQSNILCLNCHQEKYGGTKLTAHTFHLPDSPGSRCYECHMGEVLERLMMHRKDHSLDNPIPEFTMNYGIPNTCNKSGCHADRSAEWSIRTLDQWYGGENRRKVLYAAEGMWLAKKKDRAAIPLLVRAMSDGNLRLNQRASAIGALRRAFGRTAPEAIPPLERLLASDEPLLRVAALEALAQVADRSIAPRLVPLLDDPERVVRITAVGALQNLQLVTLTSPSAEAAYTRVKQEYLEALRSWPNVPEFRVNIGNYHLLNQEFDQAIAEYQTAIQINPELREAWYFLGVGYAMSGKQAKALEALRKAKSLGPDAEHIDRMIAVVQQSKSQ